METEYVVYAHKHPEKKEYVYIGSGQPGRMFCKRRQPDHMIWLEDNLSNYMLKDLVVSLGVFKEKKEALKLERELIKEHQPKFNKQGVTYHLETNAARTLTGRKLSEEHKANIKKGMKIGHIPKVNCG